MLRWLAADAAPACGRCRAADAALVDLRPEDCRRGRNRGFGNAAQVAPVLDEQRSQLAQPTQHDERQRAGDRRQLRTPEAGAVGEADKHVSERHHGEAIQGPGHGPERGRLADPAQRDRRARPDVVDIGLGRLTDLVSPLRLGIDGRLDVGDQVLVVSAQQLDKTLFLAGELLVEGALRGARVPNDVGNGGVAIAALADRGGEPVEQPVAKGVGVGWRLGRGRAIVERCLHFTSRGALALVWYQAVPYYTHLRYTVVPGKRLGVI